MQLHDRYLRCRHVECQWRAAGRVATDRERRGAGQRFAGRQCESRRQPQCCRVRAHDCDLCMDRRLGHANTGDHQCRPGKCVSQRTGDGPDRRTSHGHRRRYRAENRHGRCHDHSDIRNIVSTGDFTDRFLSDGPYDCARPDSHGDTDVSPATIAMDGAATLTWSSTGADSCTAGGLWAGSKATSGSQSTGALTATSSFTLFCTGQGGDSMTQSVTVTVTPAPPPPPPPTGGGGGGLFDLFSMLTLAGFLAWRCRPARNSAYRR